MRRQVVRDGPGSGGSLDRGLKGLCPGRRAAILYSLIASARLHGLDPFAYLRDLFERLPTHPRPALAELTPAAWAQALQAPVQAAA